MRASPIMIFLLLSCTYFADSVTTHLVAYKSQEALGDSFLLLELSNSTNSFISVKKTDAAGEFTILLPEGTWRARAITFDGKSNVNGVSQETELIAGGTGEFYIFPAGTVRGTITNANGKEIDSAPLDIDCSSPVGKISYSSGSSFTEFLPVGKCRFNAKGIGTFGSAEAEISEGKTADVNITLSQPDIFSPLVFVPPFPVLIATAAILALAALFAYFVLAKKHKQKTEFISETKTNESSGRGEETKPKPMALTKKMKDILATLDERQKSVVEFLISQPGNRARQSKIRYACRIPKTSFFRVVRSLAKKNIIETEKYLNTKEIALTGWFLSE